ncbi:MAG: 50S ribosomal protein L11 methyltransferase [Muribaculaceae bacterium]|nr:50S ribosomal protein L11 methyltransferase [Muribaculaceae bacterium]
MNDYIELRIDATPCDEVVTDVLASMLADVGYESFVPDEHGLTAYVKSEDFSDENLNSVIESFPIPFYEFKFATTKVEGRDWNEEWEKNYFQPIVIDDKCVIHSSFHRDFPKCDYDIVIDPKMAFGTGHHPTTSLIIRSLLAMPLEGQSVIDMGTGTGILAILAAMRGASPITAIEIDGFAYENAVDNVRINAHPEINVIHGDASALKDVAPADIFIANINRNIITNDLGAYAAAMKPNATLLLSGFYEEDVEILLNEAEKYNLKFVRTASDNRWACLQLRKA